MSSCVLRVMKNCRIYCVMSKNRFWPHWAQKETRPKTGVEVFGEDRLREHIFNGRDVQRFPNRCPVFSIWVNRLSDTIKNHLGKQSRKDIDQFFPCLKV